MSLALDTNTGGLCAAMEARFASRDERTTARLDWWVKVAGRCYGCQAHVSDEVAALHPGVCATCHRRKKLKPLAIPAEFGLAIVRDHAPAHDAPANQEPPVGGEEKPMRGKRETPWPCCGSNSYRHRKGCEKAGAGKAIDVPVTRKVARPAAARVVRAELSGTLLAQVSASTNDGLRALRDAIDAEFKVRLAKMESEVRALREAIGEET